MYALLDTVQRWQHLDGLSHKLYLGTAAMSQKTGSRCILEKPLLPSLRFQCSELQSFLYSICVKSIFLHGHQIVRICCRANASSHYVICIFSVALLLLTNILFQVVCIKSNKITVLDCLTGPVYVKRTN